MMQDIIVLRGLPGSGKSTLARRMVEDGFVIVSRDSVRFMLTGSDKKTVLSRELEEAVTAIVRQSVTSALKAGHRVVLDATHLRNRDCTDWIKFGEAHEAEVGFISVETPLEECLKNNATRGENAVPEEVIRNMYDKFFRKGKLAPVSYDRGPVVKFKEYTPDYKKHLPHAYIVDIDGTMAEMVDRGPFEFDKVGTDVIKEPVARVVQSLKDVGFEIVFVSGRSDSCRSETQEWLDSYGWGDHELHMRKAGDQRKDAIVKHEIFWDQIAPRFHVRGAFDDRRQVTEMFRQIGLTVFQVEFGEF